MVCTQCKRGYCDKCVNVGLELAGRPHICQCIKQRHSGEPNSKQILDPVTQEVHAPGLVFDSDGQVFRTELPGIDDLMSGGARMAAVPCGLGCGNPVNPHDMSTWKQVTGWVGGPKKDSMRLREDTGLHAHNACVQKMQVGQTVTQPDMFGE